MTQLRRLQFLHQALQNYRKRIKRLNLDPGQRSHAIETADRLEAKVRARWGVYFGAFLRQMNGRG